MSTVRANSITNSAGTGAPDFPNGLTVNGGPVSGTQTFTAKGTIPSGAVVGLNLDGTVSVVSPYYGSPADFDTNASADLSATYDPVNARVVVAYSDLGNSNYRTAVVGTVSGTSITFGTPVVFFAGGTNFDGTACVFDVASGKVVIAYTNASAQGTAIVGTVSGTSISFGSPTIFETGATNGMSCAYDSVNNKVVISYRDSGNSGFGTAVVGTVSGTSISFGTPVVFRSASTFSTSCVYATTSGRIVIFYQDAGNSDFGTAIVGTVSGTSISFGTPVVFHSVAVSIDGRGAVYASTTDKIVVTYINRATTPDTVTAIVGTVSGTSISFGSPVSLYVNPTLDSFAASCCFNPTTGVVSVQFLYPINGSSTYIVFLPLFVTGTTVNAGTLLFGDPYAANSTIITAGSVSVAAYANRLQLSGAARSGTAQVVNMSSTMQRPIGVADEAIANGAEGSITIRGGINGQQTGLAAGVRYGISATTGNLTANETALVVGYALSATELYAIL